MAGNPQWKKGESGNPGGRPKMNPELRKALTNHTMEALEVVINILRDNESKHSDKIRAAEFIYAYALGKPVQEQVVSVGENEISADNLTADQLMEKINEFDHIMVL